MSLASKLERNRTEREDRRHPDADVDALQFASREPERHREDERGEGGDENNGRGADSRKFSQLIYSCLFLKKLKVIPLKGIASKWLAAQLTQQARLDLVRAETRSCRVES